jgi:hypothetical protein
MQATPASTEIVLQNLRRLRNVFGTLTPDEKREALQCMLKQAPAHPEKLVLEVCELADFQPGSPNHSEWRPYRESNPGYHRERVVS